MWDVLRPSGIRAALLAAGLAPLRSLGQSFLADTNIRDAIVRIAQIEPEEVILEIGPGLGGLTEGLLRAGARVVAVEKDAGLVRFLKEHLKHPRLHLIHADALTLPLHGLVPPGGAKVVSNIPYAITSPLIVRLLPVARRGAVLMVQKEVAERLLAPPGSRLRGALTIYVEAHGRAVATLPVPARAFYPVPRVDSTVLVFHHRPDVGGIPSPGFFRLVQGLFRYRRKTIRAGLRHLGLPGPLFDRLKREIPTLLDQRPEELSLDAFLLLYRSLGGDVGDLPEPDQGQDGLRRDV